MGRKRIYNRRVLADELFDRLAERPEGLEIGEIADSLGVPVNIAREVVKVLRQVLAEGDRIAVPVNCEGGRWLYTLSGDTGETGPVQGWTRRRMGAATANLETDVMTWAALAQNVDGRTSNGKMTRYVAKSMARIQEDIKDLFPELDREHEVAA